MRNGEEKKDIEEVKVIVPKPINGDRQKEEAVNASFRVIYSYSICSAVNYSGIIKKIISK